MNANVTQVVDRIRNVFQLEQQRANIDAQIAEHYGSIETLLTGRFPSLTKSVRPAKRVRKQAAYTVTKNKTGKVGRPAISNATKIAREFSTWGERKFTTDDVAKILRGTARPVVQATMSGLIKAGKVTRAEGRGTYQWAGK